MYNHANKDLMIEELEQDAKDFAKMAKAQTSERLKAQYEDLSSAYRGRAEELRRLR